MTTDEQPIIYLQQPQLSLNSEPTLSMDSGAMNMNNDEEGLNYLPSDSPTPTTAAASSPHWIKKHYLPISLAFLVLTGVVFASVVFAPGGPGNSNNKNMQANLAAANTRGTDTSTNGDGDSFTRPDGDSPTYWPTYWPTYGPTPGGPEEEIIDTPVTVFPTPTPTVLTPPTSSPISPKPTFPPNLDFSGLFTPTPPPTTDVPTDIPTDIPTSNPTISPTIEASGQVSETVSTEVTGPPTNAPRPTTAP
mmetsp:Transcript_1596/g.2023  ORF Transcript_1596/g.2023 Transcript_1596/m.2023 type:complete len:248 (+) Transcript_1596:76-819(+)